MPYDVSFSGGHALSRQFGYPLGALVFLMRSGGACFYALEPSQVAPPDAAADDSRANHGGGGGGGGGDAGPSESLMHEEDADGETAASPSLAGGPAKKSAPPSLASGGGPGPKKALDSKATEIARRKNRKQERRREEEAAKRALLDLRHKFDADRRLMRREALQFVMHDVVHLAGQREAARQKPWYVLDPYGWLMTCVDMTSALALIFTVLVTPFEVAFLEPAHAWNDPLFLTNRAVDVFFIIELLLQFFLMYRPPHRGQPNPRPTRPPSRSLVMPPFTPRLPNPSSHARAAPRSNPKRRSNPILAGTAGRAPSAASRPTTTSGKSRSARSAAGTSPAGSSSTSPRSCRRPSTSSWWRSSSTRTWTRRARWPRGPRASG